MSTAQQFPYATHLDVKFPALTVVDVPQLVDTCTDRWYNQTLCQVNDSVARLGVFEPGEYHWHQHHDEDEDVFLGMPSPPSNAASGCFGACLPTGSGGWASSRRADGDGS